MTIRRRAERKTDEREPKSAQRDLGQRILDHLGAGRDLGPGRRPGPALIERAGEAWAKGKPAPKRPKPGRAGAKAGDDDTE